VPAVFKVAVKVFVPEINAAFEGRTALESLEVIVTLSVAPGIRFQNASTALTVRLNTEAAVCAVGVPVLPEAVPGAEDSPGSRTCKAAKAAGFTIMLLEVAFVRPEAVKLIVIVSATL